MEVQRILAGHALYASPSVGYVPDGYPPLYFATSAAAASVLGLSYLPLRLVSLVSSLACFAVLARLVQRETASAAAGIAAAGLLAATYFVTRHLVRRRPGRLAVHRAQRRRPVRGAVDAPHAGRRRDRPAARGRVPHQAERPGRRGRGAHRGGVRPAAAARLDCRPDLRRGGRDQHARARAHQPRLVRVLRLRAAERAHPEVTPRSGSSGPCTCCPCSASPALPWCWGCGGRRWCWSPGRPRWWSRATPSLVHSGGRGQRRAARVPRGGAARRAGHGRPARRPGGPGRGPAGPRPARELAGGAGRPVGRRRGRRPGHRAAGRADERLPSGPGDPDERGPRRRPAADGGDARPRRHDRGPLRPRSRPAGRAAGRRPPGRDGRRAARRGPGGHRELQAQRRPRGGGAAVQRDRDRERRAAGRLPARPGALLPPLPADAAPRRAARRYSSRSPGRPDDRSTYGCRTARRARRRSARSTARPTRDGARPSHPSRSGGEA